MIYFLVAVTVSLWLIPNLCLFIGHYLVAHSTALAEMRKKRTQLFNEAYGEE